MIFLIPLALAAAGAAASYASASSKNAQFQNAARERMRTLGIEQQQSVDAALAQRHQRRRESIAAAGRLRAAMGGSGVSGGVTQGDLIRQLDRSTDSTFDKINANLSTQLSARRYNAHQDAIRLGAQQSSLLLSTFRGASEGYATGLALSSSIDQAMEASA